MRTNQESTNHGKVIIMVQMIFSIVLGPSEIGVGKVNITLVVPYGFSLFS